MEGRNRWSGSATEWQIIDYHRGHPEPNTWIGLQSSKVAGYYVEKHVKLNDRDRKGIA